MIVYRLGKSKYIQKKKGARIYLEKIYGGCRIQNS